MENLANVEIKEDLRQARAYGDYIERIGWRTVKVGKTQMFVRKLGPVSIAKIQRVRLPILENEVDFVLRENRVVMCKLEPSEGRDVPPGFHPDSWPLLGTKTLRVDLRPNEAEIFERFKKDARYILRRTREVKRVVDVNKFDDFYDIWKMSSKRKNLWIPSRKDYNGLIEAFGKNCFCVTIDEMAGAVVLVHEKSAFYYYAGATREGNENNLPYLVVWEAMREAKRRGARVWDFEGIYDER